jgi:hypothetical protein
LATHIHLQITHLARPAKPGEVGGGKIYDLDYQLECGLGASVNALSSYGGANCKLVHEYYNYKTGIHYYMDDKYCNEDVPFGHRVM